MNDFALVWGAIVVFVLLVVPLDDEPLAISRFLWRRLRETDADRAQRYLAESRQLLDKARDLGVAAQQVSRDVESEFERRLRLVDGEPGGRS